MLAPRLVAEVRRLLAEGRLSQRTIARWTGVSRGTVNAIAQGKRRGNERQREESRLEFTPPLGPLLRCRECGGLVQMPCLLCQLRAMKQRQRLSGNALRPPAEIVRQGDQSG